MFLLGFCLFVFAFKVTLGAVLGAELSAVDDDDDISWNPH